MTTYTRLENSDLYISLEKYIVAYLDEHITGGSLHIVLEDNNTERSSILFCYSYAKEREDWIAMGIAERLLKMEQDEIDWFFESYMGWG